MNAAFRRLLLCVMAFASVSAHAAECLIAIDAGHTRQEQGATSARGVGEWYFNITLAKKLAASLDKERIPHVLVNPDGDAISLQDRVEKARKAGATLLLSLHHDSVQPHYLNEWEWEGKKRFYSDRFSGYSLFVSSGNPYYQESLEIAAKIAAGMLEKGLSPTLHHAEPIPGENRLLLDDSLGIYQFDDLAVLRESSSAAVLVEAGVILNREEETAVMMPAYQEKVIDALRNAIRAHCKKCRAW